MAPAQVLIAHVPFYATPYGEPVSAHTCFLISDALRTVGHEVADLMVGSQADLVGLAASHPGAVVLNLCYGIQSAECGEELDQPSIAAVLEDLGVNLVGSDSAGQRRCQDKVLTAKAAASVGIDSPRTLSLEEAIEQTEPVVVKPRRGAAHRDVRLVTDSAELVGSPRDDDLLIQEYVDGPEYTIAVLGDPDSSVRALPLVRIRYDRRPGIPGVYDWFSTTIAPDSSHRFGLAETALELFRTLGLRDYARFDFRVVAHRGPVLLDANALPSLAPRQHLAISARWAGILYPELIRGLVALAVHRGS